MMAPKHLYFCYESDDRMELKHGCVSDSLSKMLISAIFFSGAVLEHLTDHKDSNMLLNFWINGQAFINLFQKFNNMSGYRDISLQSWSPK